MATRTSACVEGIRQRHRRSWIAVACGILLALTAAGTAQGQITLAPPSASVVQGETTPPVAVSLVFPWCEGGTATLAFSNLPPGATTRPAAVTYSVTSACTAQTSFRISTTTATPPGRHRILINDPELQGEKGSAGFVIFELTVIERPAPSQFTLAPASASVVQGETTPPIAVSLVFPWCEGGTATLAFSNLPPGAATRPPAVTYSVTPACTAQTSFRISTTTATPPGRHRIRIDDPELQGEKGSAGVAIFDLTVIERPPASFSAAIVPCPIELRVGGPPVTVTVTTTADPGLPFDIVYSFEGLPGFIDTGGPRTSSRPGFPPVSFPFSVTAGATEGTFSARLVGSSPGGDVRIWFPCDVAVTRGGTVQLSLMPPQVTVCDGGPGADVTLRLQPSDGYTGTPRVDLDPLPPGLAVNPPRLSVPSLPPPHELRFQVVAAGAAAGIHTLRLQVTDPGVSMAQTITLPVTVVAADFSPAVTPSSLVVQASGDQRTLTAGVQPNQCFAPDRLEVGVSGMPPGVTIDPTTATGRPPAFGPLSFNVSVDRGAAAGTYPLQFAFQPQPGNRKTVPVTLTITPAPDFELVVVPPAASVPARESVDVTVAVRALNGFTDPVHVTVAPMPGLSASPSAFDLQPGASQPVSIAVDRDHPQGQVSLRFTGVSRTVPEPRTADLLLMVFPPRPTERVEGPRVDRASPDRLEPGGRYSLSLLGRNLTPDTTVSFGPDVTNVGALFVLSPTEARLDVLVGPAALPGVRLAVATNREGSNRGPGGVEVIVSRVSVQPVRPRELPSFEPIPPGCDTLTNLAFERGKIFLESPMWQGEWVGDVWQHHDVPLLDDETVFEWREANPGTAEYFELRVYDRLNGELVITRRIGGMFGTTIAAGLPLTYFRPDAQFLADLFEALPYNLRWARGIFDPGAGGQPPAPPPVGSSGATGLTFTTTGGSGVAGLQPEEPPGAPGAIQLAVGDLLWEVAGFKVFQDECVEPPAGGLAAYPLISGGRHVEVEVSERWPLDLPLPPTGRDCPPAGRSGVAVEPMVIHPLLDEHGEPVPGVSDTQNYPGDSFMMTGTFSLARSPFASHPVQTNLPPEAQADFGAVMTLAFDNLFVDWGDGSPVEQVEIVLPDTDSSAPSVTWNRGIPLRLPEVGDEVIDRLSGPQWGGMGSGWFGAEPPGMGGSIGMDMPVPLGYLVEHTYTRTGSFRVRFFQLSTDDVQNVDLHALAIAMHGGGEQAEPGEPAPPTTGPNFGLSGGASASLAPNTPLGRLGYSGPTWGIVDPDAIAALATAHEVAGRAFVIHCADVLITNRTDPVARGPLQLEFVEIDEFPPYPTSHTDPRIAALERELPGSAGGGPLVFTAVSGCDETVVAEGRLGFYGRGWVQLTWVVDGMRIDGPPFFVASPERQGLGGDPTGWPPPLLGVEPITSPILPVDVVDFHRVTVEARVVAEPDSQNLQAALTILASGTTDPGAIGFASQVVANHGGASGSTPIGFLTQGHQASSWMPAVSMVPVGAVPPDVWRMKPWWVESREAVYAVVAADPDQPCTFLFPTRRGDFMVSGLHGNVERIPPGGDRFTGRGKLKLPLMTSSGAPMDWIVAVELDNWKVPDLVHVEEGSLLETPGEELPAGGGPAADGSLDRLAGEAGAQNDLELTLTLEPSDNSLRIPGATEQPPQWTATAPLSADGSWYAAATVPGGAPLRLPESLIKPTVFRIRSDDVRIDWSRSEGEGASPRCDGAAGPGWLGVHLGDATVVPYLFAIAGVGDLELHVDDWALEGDGLCGEAHTTQQWRQEIGDGWIAVDSLDITVDDGILDAVYEMRLFVPWLETEFGGEAELVEGTSGITFPFEGAEVTREYGAAKERIVMTADHLRFGSVPGNPSWVVSADTDFTLFADERQLAQFSVDDMVFNFRGRATFGEGEHTWSTSLGGESWLGDTPVTLSSVELNTPSSGARRLDIKTLVDARLSQVLAAVDVQVNYDITRRAAHDYIGSGPATVFLEFPEVIFPEGSSQPAVHTVMRPHYDGSHSTNYYGEVDVGLFGGPPVTGQLRLGYDSPGNDYWLVSADYDFGVAGPPLVPGILKLFSVGGGLGYNFAPEALVDTANIQHAVPDMLGAYLLNARMKVGSPADNGFGYFFKGDFTVRPDPFLARMDYGAWLLTNDHGGDGHFYGHFQYGNGEFDGALGGSLDLVGGSIHFDLGTREQPAVNLHFGGGDWHIHAGEQHGQRIGCTFLGLDAQGYVMLGSDGLFVGADHYIYMGASLGPLEGHIEGNIGGGVTLQPGPYASGEAHGSVAAEVCCCELCIGPSVSANVRIGAWPPDFRCRACFGFNLLLGEVRKCATFSYP